MLISVISSILGRFVTAVNRSYDSDALYSVAQETRDFFSKEFRLFNLLTKAAIVAFFLIPGSFLMAYFAFGLSLFVASLSSTLWILVLVALAYAVSRMGFRIALLLATLDVLIWYREANVLSMAKWGDEDFRHLQIGIQIVAKHVGLSTRAVDDLWLRLKESPIEAGLCEHRFVGSFIPEYRSLQSTAIRHLAVQMSDLNAQKLSGEDSATTDGWSVYRTL